MHVHVEPFCGASGDMLLGALVDAGVPLEVLREAVAGLGIAGLDLQARKVDKRGIAATKVDVTAPHQHVHRHLPDIEALLGGGRLADAVAASAIATFRALAVAEAAVHDMPVDAVHFHEVGALDAIADVVAAAAGFHHLQATTVSCRALPLSHGTVRCEHGLLPVPAPAVMRLAEGLPTVPLDVSGETVTPTAAALLRTLVTHWGNPPAMRLTAHGYGAGSKDFDRANVLRLMVGEAAGDVAVEQLAVLETNVDDMNPEWLPAVLQRLLDGGARDAWLTPTVMKKGRPAHTLSVLADPPALPRLRDIVYAHTTSLGIRETQVTRHHLPRELVNVTTSWGPIRLKVATLPDGSRRAAPEFEDCRRISETSGVPLQTLYEAALRAWREPTGS